MRQPGSYAGRCLKVAREKSVTNSQTVRAETRRAIPGPEHHVGSKAECRIWALAGSTAAVKGFGKVV